MWPNAPKANQPGRIASLAALALWLFSSGAGFPQTHFYQGKTITVVQATEPGGSSDSSPFILPPGTPREPVKILREAMVKTFRDPEFAKEYNKLVGEEPTPLMPEDMEKVLKDLPRDPEIVELFKKLNAAETLPAR